MQRRSSAQSRRSYWFQKRYATIRPKELQSSQGCAEKMRRSAEKRHCSLEKACTTKTREAERSQATNSARSNRLALWPSSLRLVSMVSLVDGKGADL